MDNDTKDDTAPSDSSKNEENNQEEQANVKSVDDSEQPDISSSTQQDISTTKDKEAPTWGLTAAPLNLASESSSFIGYNSSEPPTPLPPLLHDASKLHDTDVKKDTGEQSTSQDVWVLDYHYNPEGNVFPPPPSLDPTQSSFLSSSIITEHDIDSAPKQQQHALDLTRSSSIDSSQLISDDCALDLSFKCSVPQSSSDSSKILKTDQVLIDPHINKEEMTLDLSVQKMSSESSTAHALFNVHDEKTLAVSSPFYADKSLTRASSMLRFLSLQPSLHATGKETVNTTSMLDICSVPSIASVKCHIKHRSAAIAQKMMSATHRSQCVPDLANGVSSSSGVKIRTGRSTSAVNAIDIDAREERKYLQQIENLAVCSKSIPALTPDMKIAPGESQRAYSNIKYMQQIKNKRGTPTSMELLPRTLSDGPRHAYVRSKQTAISTKHTPLPAHVLHRMPLVRPAAHNRLSYHQPKGLYGYLVKHDAPSAEKHLLHHNQTFQAPQSRHIVASDSEDSILVGSTSPRSPTPFDYNKFQLPDRLQALHQKHFPTSPTTAVMSAVPISQQYIAQRAQIGPGVNHPNVAARALHPCLGQNGLDLSPCETCHGLRPRVNTGQRPHPYPAANHHSLKQVNSSPYVDSSSLRHSSSPLKISQDGAIRMSAQIRKQKKELEAKITKLISLEQRLNAEAGRITVAHTAVSAPPANYMTVAGAYTGGQTRGAVGPSPFQFGQVAKRKLITAEQLVLKQQISYSASAPKRVRPTVPAPSQQPQHAQQPVCPAKVDESCGACGFQAYFVCSGCRKIWYCCKKCQFQDWEKHSKFCA